MSAYAEKLKDPRWQKKRLQILERDNWACYWCGDTETTLHVHHETYNGKNPWDTWDECLITLCADCHAVRHLKLSPLELFLLKALLARDRGNTEMIKMINRLIIRIVENRRRGVKDDILNY